MRAWLESPRGSRCLHVQAIETNNGRNTQKCRAGGFIFTDFVSLKGLRNTTSSKIRAKDYCMPPLPSLKLRTPVVYQYFFWNFVFEFIYDYLRKYLLREHFWRFLDNFDFECGGKGGGEDLLYRQKEAELCKRRLDTPKLVSPSSRATIFTAYYINYRFTARWFVSSRANAFSCFQETNHIEDSTFFHFYCQSMPRGPYARV